MSTKRKTHRAKSSTTHSSSSSTGLDQIAKKLMPKWRVVQETPLAADAAHEVDAVSPKLTRLGGEDSATVKSARKVQFTLQRSRGNPQKKLSGLVNMAPNSEEDARLGAKTQVIEDDEHTASQG
jgi:hypothetical protein